MGPLPNKPLGCVTSPLYHTYIVRTLIHGGAPLRVGPSHRGSVHFARVERGVSCARCRVHGYRDRDNTIRIISARKATKRERQRYDERWRA
jgi:hypothetical protein